MRLSLPTSRASREPSPLAAAERRVGALADQVADLQDERGVLREQLVDAGLERLKHDAEMVALRDRVSELQRPAAEPSSGALGIAIDIGRSLERHAALHREADALIAAGQLDEDGREGFVSRFLETTDVRD